ncbi:low temperature requirement protein A [soil metagenome]
MVLAANTNLSREREGDNSGKVSFIELFFDLVFVFAITQLSHLLLAHLTVEGAIETLVLFLAVWWVWIYTSWVTNWLDPERTPVRVMLCALMLAGLVLSTSLPQAFDVRGATFACAYVFMQVGRSLFVMWAVRNHDAANYQNFQRITLWLVLSAVFWISGTLAEGHMRLMLWAVALAIEFASPALGFYVPGLGRSTTTDWNIEGHHLAERCALFIIIALGESILVTGATFAELDWSGPNLAAFLIAFLGSVAMWWIYFDTGAEHGSNVISNSDNPGRIARLVYTYIHILLIAGIIVAAVADEMALVHPDHTVDRAAALVILGGPALYVTGNLLFKYCISGRLPLSHLAGLGLLAAASPFAEMTSLLILTAVATSILVIVAVWETVSLRRYRPSLEKLDLAEDVHDAPAG